MFEIDLWKKISEININHNAGRTSDVDRIFKELREKNLTLKFFATVFATENSPYFLLKYHQQWNYFRYSHWLEIVKELEGSIIGLIELIIWTYTFFSVDVTSYIMDNERIPAESRAYIQEQFFHQGKLKIGVSRLMKISLSPEEIDKIYGVTLDQLKEYGLRLVKEGAMPRSIENEVVYTGNTEGEIPFETILEQSPERLRMQFYENPSLHNSSLLHEILNSADKEMVRAFLDENPVIKNLLKIEDEKENMPWFMNGLNSN